MLYAYKSRSSSDFLNFVFSSPSFNDAIKRINYLKSYRSYREMSGANIARTQALLKDGIDELSGNKQKKSVVLQIQSKEVDALQVQQEEKNTIVNKLKAQGKELNNQIAAKKKQMQKVNNAFAAAIKRANDEARKIATATKVSEDRNRKVEELNNKKDNTTTNTKTGKKSRTVTEPVNTKSVFVGTDAELSLNTNFERNRGNLPWPVNSGYILLHYGLNKLGNGVEVISEVLSIGTEVGTAVKAIFDGEVKAIDNYDDLQMVVIKHGMYFTGYSNITGVNLKKGQMVSVGQVIGKVSKNLDGVGAIDLMISKDKSELNPETWLKRR
jgi:septal ring factor EnvC (AmiA/AmiB activator)